MRFWRGCIADGGCVGLAGRILTFGQFNDAGSHGGLVPVDSFYRSTVFWENTMLELLRRVVMQSSVKGGWVDLIECILKSLRAGICPLSLSIELGAYRGREQDGKGSEEGTAHQDHVDETLSIRSSRR